ncbi:MAG: TetR/AcrR family transcriptional regulator [Pseudonocardia sp.]|nr:TetR/AcrR family transcriptional regulator [Pseudonocardia sp.]
MTERVRTTTQARSGKGVIVDSAIRNIRTLGYHGTTMRGIAHGAGITVASIYHHFGAKQEVLQEIMVVALQDLIGATRAAVLDAGASPSDQLAAMVRAWILFHTTRQPEALIGSTEIRSLDPHGRDLVIALRDEQEHFFRDVVRRGVDSGDFHTSAPPAEAARAIINMGSSVAAWYSRSGGTTPTEMADTYAELALGTVRADRPGP